MHLIGKNGESIRIVLSMKLTEHVTKLPLKLKRNMENICIILMLWNGVDTELLLHEAY